MFKKILVPTDGTPLSDKAVNGAVEFARQSGATIVGLTVVEPYPLTPTPDGAHIGGAEAFRQRQQESAEFRLSRIRSVVSLAGVSCETIVAESSSPHTEIVAAVQRLGCDLIVMASHKHGGLSGLGRLIVGSQTQKVLAEAPVPVLVYR